MGSVRQADEEGGDGGEDARQPCRHHIQGKHRIPHTFGHGSSIVSRGVGTGTRTQPARRRLSWVMEAFPIDTNVAQGIRKPEDNVRERRVSEAEHSIPGKILTKADADDPYIMVDRKGVDIDGSSFLVCRQQGRKVGPAARPVGGRAFREMTRRACALSQATRPSVSPSSTSRRAGKGR